MQRKEIVSTVRDTGVVAIVRGVGTEQIAALAGALYDGGIRAVEVTMNTPDVLSSIRLLTREFAGRMAVGAGTVLSVPALEQAAEAGAQFIVAPNVNPDVIAAAHRRNLAVIPGALTPTEIQQARDAGADLIKLFPAELGGPSYLQSVRGPYDDVELVATGAIGPHDAGAYIAAGATAVGVGGPLFTKALEQGPAALTRLAAELIAAVRRGRQGG